MNPDQTWKIGDVIVEVKSTKEPWADGVGDSAVVLASGLHGTLRGKLAQFWRTELEGGRQVIRRISDQIRQSLWVEPARPLWMVLPISMAGEVKEYNICVATAFDRHGPHPNNAKRAVLALAADAERRGIRRLSVPLLGAGAGGLDSAEVAQRELEAIVVHSEGGSEGLKVFTILVREDDLDAIVKTVATFVRSTLGADKWYKAIEVQGRFSKIRVLESLEGGYSGARLDVCEVRDENGARLPLMVFKIGPKEMIQQEEDGASHAQNLLGEFAVEVAARYVLDSKFDALRMPLATEEHSGQPALSFLRFYKESGDPREVARLVQLLFGRATRSIYEGAIMQYCKLADLREEMERTRQRRYWDEAGKGFTRLLLATNTSLHRGGARVSLGFPVDEIIDDPFHENAPIARAWDQLLDVPMAKRTHGDLNPRNVVMIRRANNNEFVPRIIDFHRFGTSGPLAMDFARFEAGIHVKCLEKEIRNKDVGAADALIQYEALVVSEFVPATTGSLVGSVAAEFTKAVFAVSAIRGRYAELSPPEGRKCYWMCLSLCLLSYLRPVYDARLTDEQRTFASFMAANILDRYVVH
jgi:hypothetical protein